MFFEHSYKLLVWVLSFGIMAYALWRWGKEGFSIPTENLIAKFLHMLWEIIRERPAFIIVISILSLLIGVSYILK